MYNLYKLVLELSLLYFALSRLTSSILYYNFHSIAIHLESTQESSFARLRDSQPFKSQCEGYGIVVGSRDPAINIAGAREDRQSIDVLVTPSVHSACRSG